MRRQGATSRAPDPVCRDAGREHGRLGNDGLGEFLRRPLLYELPQVVAEHLTGLGVRRRDFLMLLGEVGLHPL